MSGLKFPSFLVAAARNFTPSTFCSFWRNSGVFASDSVIVFWLIVATNLSVIMWWLTSSCVLVIVGGSSLVRIPPDWQCWGWLGLHSVFSFWLWVICLCACHCLVVFGLYGLCDFTLSVFGVCVFVASSLNTIFRKLFNDGFDERSSRASLMDSFNDELLMSVLFCFLAVGGRLCHSGSDKLSSLSEDPCHLDVFSSFLPRGSKVFLSVFFSHCVYVIVKIFLILWSLQCFSERKLIEFQIKLSRTEFVSAFVVDQFRNFRNVVLSIEYLKC